MISRLENFHRRLSKFPPGGDIPVWPLAIIVFAALATAVAVFVGASLEGGAVLLKLVDVD